MSVPTREAGQAAMPLLAGGVWRVAPLPGEMTQSGNLPAIRVGRSFRVPGQAVQDYLSESFMSLDAPTT